MKKQIKQQKQPKFELERAMEHLSYKTLERLTRDDYKPTKKELKFIIDVAFANSGKTKLTDNQMNEQINMVYIMMALELFRRMNILERTNKKGTYYWKETVFGNAVRKELNKREKKSIIKSADKTKKRKS